jgi:hypothetical protein
VVPDYSFELYFPLAARPAVLDGLGRLCTKDTAAGVEAARRHDREAVMNVVLALPPDDALGKWRQDNPDLHRGVPDGEVHVGFINLWIKRDDEGRLEVRLWPPMRPMQIACVDSPTLRRALTALLADHQGIVGYLDRGDGSLAEMWPNDELPPGYEHELVPPDASAGEWGSKRDD